MVCHYSPLNRLPDLAETGDQHGFNRAGGMLSQTGTPPAPSEATAARHIAPPDRARARCPRVSRTVRSPLPRNWAPGYALHAPLGSAVPPVGRGRGPACDERSVLALQAGGDLLYPCGCEATAFPTAQPPG
eukprot:scaffold61024_cov53-Phaeocystis_antarctica.AAC.2